MDLRQHVEHTLLSADATPERVLSHCRDARDHGLFGVCVSPRFVPLAREALEGAPVRIVTVAGFPLGTSASSVKAEEARRAALDGAHEIDMVLAIGLAKAGRLAEVEDDVRRVRDATPGGVLKVILETGYFEEQELPAIVEAALAAGADFLKTCTGFGPRGATLRDVQLLAELSAGRARVKASGGIRTADAARALVEAGAARIGTSNGVEIARAITA